MDIRIAGFVIILLCCCPTDAIRVPAFLKGIANGFWTESTTEPLNIVRNFASRITKDHYIVHVRVNHDRIFKLAYNSAATMRSSLIPPMLSKMSQFTKGMPVEYRPYPLIVGTKAELVELKKLLQETNSLPEHGMEFDTSVPDDRILSVPFAVDDLKRHMPVHEPVPTLDLPKKESCEVSIEEMLPLLRTHPLPSLVHDNPELIISMMQSLIPKPETFEVKPEIELLPSSKKLISLAVRNPDWVRALIDAEPTILNDMLGFSNMTDTAPDAPIKDSA